MPYLWGVYKMSYLRIIVLLFICPLIVTAQLIPIDLSNWTVEGNPANGNWEIASDSLSVLQKINGAPTFFVGPDTLINTVIRGNLKVETTGDDDFIGFVFGFQIPVLLRAYLGSCKTILIPSIQAQ
jgi:hypothetical protein